VAPDGKRIIMEKISIQDAEPGMVLARPVATLGSKGRERLPEGFVLQRNHIQKLRHWGVEFIFIQRVEEGDASEEMFSASVRMLARETYEDAIGAYAGMVGDVLKGGQCNTDAAMHTLSQLLDVIAIEPGLPGLLSFFTRTYEYFYRHAVDVCATALIVGRHLDINTDNLRTLGLVSMFHDVGLLHCRRDTWDNSMLTNIPGPVKEHPRVGGDMMKKVPGLDDEAMAAVLHHHEYQDGSGFPDGLKNGDISQTGAIIAIAEAYHTLIGPCSPRNAVEPHKAIGLILDPACNRFDPVVLRAFIANISLYPVGTFVQTNQEAVGLVIKTNIGKPQRPCLLMVKDNKKPITKPFPVNLGDPRYSGWYIEKSVTPDVAGGTVEQFIHI
jgi:HD-GYP domain-containing protein (c-di-GMP phosphodiesterase class II)